MTWPMAAGFAFEESQEGCVSGIRILSENVGPDTSRGAVRRGDRTCRHPSNFSDSFSSSGQRDAQLLPVPNSARGNELPLRTIHAANVEQFIFRGVAPQFVRKLVRAWPNKSCATHWP